ncbi:MAG: DegT/DnrJ/EryC1/StrS family aminotransferase [Nanoarchaeota archaeon]|nr:DegT/DnrJ/EryC1/StrS family aminotransferase [Nanoarchaeota archaeon]
MTEEIKKQLIEFTGCSNIKIVKNGNKAILYALRIAKRLGKINIFIQDQGGWITYYQYPKRLNLEIIKLKTNFGLIDKHELASKLDDKSVLLINSMPGYLALEDMGDIAAICRENKSMIINDISGSIGTDNAKFGDIVVCSFGKDKPINYGDGGFIGVKDSDYFDIIEMQEISAGAGLADRIKTLNNRLAEINAIREQLLADLISLGFQEKLIHPSRHGINIAVRFADETEKERVINYCNKNNVEYTICPRYIRVECDAVSIEIKRLLAEDKYKTFQLTKKGDI